MSESYAARMLPTEKVAASYLFEMISFTILKAIYSSMYIYIHTHIHTQQERERERDLMQAAASYLLIFFLFP